MAEKLSVTEFRWRVAHYILYLVNNLDGRYWAYHVSAGDSADRFDLAFWLDLGDHLPMEGPFTRQQVVEIASLIGHTEEQIAAALLLADTLNTIDHHDLCRMGDEEYELELEKAKRFPRIDELRHLITPLLEDESGA